MEGFTYYVVEVKSEVVIRGTLENENIPESHIFYILVFKKMLTKIFLFFFDKCSLTQSKSRSMCY